MKTIQTLRKITAALALGLVLLLTDCAAWPALGLLGGAAGDSSKSGGLGVGGLLALLGLNRGGTSAFGSSALMGPPISLTKAYLYDCDANGVIDEIVLEFSDSVVDSSITDADAAQFRFGGKSAARIDSTTGGTGVASCSRASAGGVDPESANDRFVTLFPNNSALAGFVGTGPASFAYTQTADHFANSGGGFLESFQLTSASSVFVDRARPVIVNASGDSGTNVLYVEFSEAVDRIAGDAACSGSVQTTDLTYANAGGGASAISSGSSLSACGTGPYRLTLNLNANLTAADLVDASDSLNDTIRPNSETIFDNSGNSAVSLSVPLRGVVHPYVLAINGTGSSSFSASYSEPVVAGEASSASNYSVSCTTTAECGSCGTTPLVASCSQTTTSEYACSMTGSQAPKCLYTVSVSPNQIHDLNESAALTANEIAAGQFLGNEPFRLTSANAAVAQSIKTVLLTFNRDILLSDATNPDNFAVSSALGTVTLAVRYDMVTGMAADQNKVLMTHSLAQGVSVYSVRAAANVRDASGQTISALEIDRTASFQGFGGSVEKLEDGALFDDPFSDGSSFAFAFDYRNKIYLGPNDNNNGVYRIDPDGANPTVVKFNITSNTGNFSSFGASIQRPAQTVAANGAAARFYITPGTDLSKYDGSAKITVTGCSAAGNNIASARTVSSVNDSEDYVEVDLSPGSPSGSSTPGSDTCMVTLFNGKGPASNAFDGVDSFVKATLSGIEYLILGGHNEGGAGFNELYHTTAQGNVLDIKYCSIAPVTIGNTVSLSNITGDGSRIYIGFSASASGGRQPGFASMTGLPTSGNCTGLNDLVQAGSGAARYANAISYLGGAGTPANPASFIGMDNARVLSDAGGAKLWIMNNGGVSYTTTIPPSLATYTNVLRDGVTIGGGATLAGAGTVLPDLGKVRPGQKAYPFMISFGNYLYLVRNYANGGYRGEILRCSTSADCGNAANWYRVFDTAESGNSSNRAVSMLTVNGSRLYVGMDNETDGAEVFVSTNGDSYTRTGVSGLGPASAGASSRALNKYLQSSASVFYQGKNYLYITAGCNSDFRDNGPCDRNAASGQTNFAFKVFRQVD